MKRVLTIGAVLVLVVFLSASMLVAQEKAAAEKGKVSCEMEKASCQKEMKLTDDQKAKIEAMRTNLRLKMIDLRAERAKLAIALGEEIKKPDPNMTEIQGILKKLSDVREKIQLAVIGHAIEMRKLVGPEWRTLMRGELREFRETMEKEEGPGMAGESEERDVMIGRGPMRGMWGMGARARMMMPRMMERRAVREEQAEGEEGGGCMMHREGMGEMKGGCMMMQKEGACGSNMHGNWNRTRFRPYGRSSGCCCMGGCMMHKGGMEGMKGGCGMQEMKGCQEGAGSDKSACKVKIIKIEKKE
jgi:Spy/CpxP family protein refolding chaperone